MYAHGRSQRSSEEPATIEDVHNKLFSPRQRESKKNVTPTGPKRQHNKKGSGKKRKGKLLENVHKRNKADSEAVLIAEDIRSLWIDKQITKAEIGLRLLEKTVDPDGKHIKNGKKLVQEIVQLLTETPRVAQYSTIRGWINAARKAKVKYGESVQEKFTIQMKDGSPAFATSADITRYIDKDMLNQKAGNFEDLKEFLTQQMVAQYNRRGLQVHM